MTTNLSLDDIQNRLFKIVKDFLRDLGAERAQQGISHKAKLDDLGIGSLERARLFYLIEKEFNIKLPEAAMSEVITFNDLAIAIQNAKPEIDREKTHEYQKLAATKIDPSQADTLNEVIELYAKNEPNRPHIYLLSDDNNEEVILYGKLYDEAAQIAQGLIDQGLKPAETVAIMLPTCADFFYSFFGTLLAGGIPVPIYPPFRPDQIEEYAKREVHILANAEVRFLITFRQAESLSKLLKPFVSSLKAVVTADTLKKKYSHIPKLQHSKNDSAMIQYTSGSTGNPKGVLLTHFNLLSNIRAYGVAAKAEPTDVAVSWLPLYHDMGLIGMWLGSLYYGLPVTIMSPLRFLSRPENWLWEIHKSRATLSGGPNFAYELCVQKIADKDIEGLDLSSWRIAFNGAEAIYPRTLKMFTKRFEKYGFKPEAFLPVYGLAESSVALTFPEIGHLPRIDRIAREPYEKELRAIPFAADTKNSLEFVSCGKPLVGHEIRIIDESNRELPERHIGRLQFRGPSSMQGYYHNPEATAEIYKNQWWDSGDLAYIAEGDVFITGRKKDVIIKGGRNIYPPEIEEIVNEIPGVRRGCAVAFGVKDLQQGTEKFIIVAETNVTEEKSRREISSKITHDVTQVLGIPPDEVLMVPPRTIPKTSSGKLRRSSMLQAYVQGRIKRKKAPIWMQFIKLKSSSWFIKLKHSLINFAKLIYTSYIVLLLIALILPLWFLVSVVSSKTAGKLVHNFFKVLLFLGGISLEVSGEKSLTEESFIYVSNHASYLDTIVLLSILPNNVVMVGKKELLKAPILKTFIRKLNYVMVNRLDFAQSLADAEEIQKVLFEKKSLLIFPEGTFTYATGLRPFKLGAFKIAVETKTPIRAVALAGTRKIFRGNNFLLRPGKVKIHISRPITPENQEWSEVIRLRDKAKLYLAKYCGEPSLDIIRAGIEEDIS